MPAFSVWWTNLQYSPIMVLKDKKIILAVSGSIAAYKTPEIVRQLIKKGASVRVIMTPSAADFVTPLSLSTVSRNPVQHSVSDGASWNNHVEMGRWADVMLIAPCSTNTLAKLAGGICDNLLCAVYLSATCPVFVAPAMDADMWIHPSTKRNIETIASYGNHLIPVGYGALASGLTGEGRMAEPETLVETLEQFFKKENGSLPLSNLKALVTAGPTFERLDPVRFIGNFSSGKMGIAIAEALAANGAEVQLVLGPTHLRINHKNIITTHVESADEMYKACTNLWPSMDLAVMAAAVADYAPAVTATDKIKKKEEELSLPLRKTKDILKHLGTLKNPEQLLVGFALETQNVVENAIQKLHTKNADFLVLNSLRDEGAGFGHDTNKITIFSKEGARQDFPLQSKKEAAGAIVSLITDAISK